MPAMPAMHARPLFPLAPLALLLVALGCAQETDPNAGIIKDTGTPTGDAVVDAGEIGRAHV